MKMFLADLFLPNRCPFCDAFIPYDRLCCDGCFDSCAWSDENICPVCGKSVMRECRCGKVTYDECVAAAYYTGNAKAAVIRLKFMDGVSAAAVFGRVLRDMLKVRGILDSIDAAVPVPMHRSGLSARGYNQAELIAREIVRDTDIPLRTDLLYRDEPQTAQHDLGLEERMAAALQYHGRDADLGGMTVLLADDVLTTGATFSACADILKRMGAVRVVCAAAVTA
ncbi:MAG: ComF family protein [Oscillospiraceae bacterium]|nr:ComF family protein [Oscillospiraceae bacterium]MBQ8978905.1 ComF family protein [Oscillospiraceae bacterium]